MGAEVGGRGWGNRGVTVGSDGQTDNWADVSKPLTSMRLSGWISRGSGRGIRGAFVPSLAVLSLIREVGQREKKGGPCGRGCRRPGRDWR